MAVEMKAGWWRHRPSLFWLGLTLVGVLAACAPSAPSATPLPSVLTGEDVLAAFFDLVKSPGFTAETELSGELVSGGVRVKVEADGRLAGDDGEMAVSIAQGGTTLAFEAILVGEAAYVREPEQDWQEVPRDQINASGAKLDPFEFIRARDDLQYDGTTTYRGETYHEIVNAGALELEGGEGEEGTVGLLSILVEADGTPIFLSYRLAATTVDASGSQVRATGDIEQTFTNVGDPITIAPPEGF